MNPFLDACGAVGPIRLELEIQGTAGSETRLFDLPFVLVGRDPRCDIRLSHPEVSDRHAYLQLVDGALICVDLGSGLGISQGGKRHRVGLLARDQSIRIGPYRIRLVDGDAPRHESVQEHSLALDVRHRSVRHSRCEFRGGLALVGSGSDCQVRLIDPSVGSFHCSLVAAGRGVWVVDLLGPGGVRLDGHEVSYARLHEGDLVRVGHSSIQLGGETERSDTIRPEPVRGDAFTLRSIAPVETLPVPLLPAAEVLGSASMVQAAELVERVIAPLVGQMGLIQREMVDDFHQARLMMFETFATLHQEQSSFLNHELERLRHLSHELHVLRADLERQTQVLTERAAAPIAPAVVARPASTPKRDELPRLMRAGDGAPVRHHDEEIHAELCERIARIKDEQQGRWRKLSRLLPDQLAGKLGL